MTLKTTGETIAMGFAIRDREKKSTDEHGTPWNFVRFWETYLGRKFTLDPASSTTNHKTPTFHTRRDNGLKQVWAPHTVLLNPPFAKRNGGIGAWAEYSVISARLGALVLGVFPNALTDGWGARWVRPFASELFFIEGRVRYINESRDAPFFGTIVVVWRPGLRPAGTDLLVEWVKCPLR
jgi:hypothetical protein